MSQSNDLYEIYKNAPDRYMTETADNDNQENLNNLYESESKISP